MKITFIRETNSTIKWSLCSMETFIEKVKHENKEGYISQLRLALPHLEGSHGHFIYIDRIPRVYPAVTYQRTEGNGRQFKEYNGLVQIEVNRLSGWAEVEYIKAQAALLPQTMAAFGGASGKSIKIWIRFSLPDGSLPTTEEQASFFHAHAYRLAVKCYQPLFPFPITLKEPTLQQCCRMTVDESPYYNPDAIPFCMAQPDGLDKGTSYREHRLTEENPLSRMELGYDSYHTIKTLYQTTLHRVLDQMENWKRSDGIEPLLPRLAMECFKSGIPEEEAVIRTLRHYYEHKDEVGIRTTFRNVYAEAKGFGERQTMSKEQDIAIRLEEFLKRRYEFRYNTMTDDLEYRERDSIHFQFGTVDKRVRNSIAIQALKEGIHAWDRDIDRHLNSEYVPTYNPIEEYLYDVGKWDGKDRIRPLADLVPCKHPHWRDLFYRWFLSMVAHWMGRDKQHGNATTPILIGPQGYRKSTFCRILLPPELRFGYTDSLNFSSKVEAERYLSRFFLVNLDEFDQISINQQGFLKHLLQKPMATLRKPYGNSFKEMRRYASFIATSNHKDLLTDPSGSRRFICVEVTAPIRTNAPIDYTQLYAQAVHAITHGERYWLDETDEALLKESNKEFQQSTPLEQLFLLHFETASPETNDGQWMMTMEIFEYLQSKTRDKLPIGKTAYLGRMLQKWEIPHKRGRQGSYYYLKKR